MKIFLTIFIIVLISNCKTVTDVKTNRYLNSPTPVLPTATPTFDANDSTQAAIKLVSFDKKGVMPDATNPEVQKAKQLISDLALEFKISPYEVFASASVVAAKQKNINNKEISRVNLLEGFKNLHFALPKKNRNVAKSKPLDELLMLYADLMPKK